MIAFELEQALRQVELTTEMLAATDSSDLARLCIALDDRANAITRLSLLAGESESDACPTMLERLADILVRGEAATRKLVNVRRQSAEELSVLDRLRRDLEGPDPSQGPEIELQG